MPKYDVLYKMPDSFLKYDVTPPNITWVVENYKAVRLNVEANGLDDLFYKMQGENWSPNGEARDLIKSRGLTHTSMSVGDIAVDKDNRLWFCEPMGWTKLFSVSSELLDADDPNQILV